MKVFTMAARLEEDYRYTMAVPDDWDAEDVREYYKENGANGEFEVDGMPCWEWGEATEIDDLSPEEIKKLEYIGEEQTSIKPRMKGGCNGRLFYLTIIYNLIY